MKNKFFIRKSKDFLFSVFYFIIYLRIDDMCTKKINTVVLTKQQFVEFYLNNNYNENMFNEDGNLNLNYNSNKNTGLIAQIFEDHWNNIPSNVKESIIKIKPNAEKEIKKIIDCHNKDLGCNVFQCPDCGDICFIGNTCKSRFCSSCGYKYKLERVNNIINTAYNCKHRQIVFTCAKELWPYFFVDFVNLTNIYFKAVNKTIYSILNESFKLKNGKWKKYISKTKYTPGFFTFLHTFGRSLQWHPHIHVLIAEIKLSKNKCYKWEYFDFNALSKRFMKILLDLMDEYLNDKSFKALKNKLYKKYKNGFYVYAEKKNFKNIKDGVEYVTRYCGRVAISENRIINYDGNNVTYCYNSHVDNSYHEITVTATQFITILLMHLLPYNFKIIRYYGFYRKKHSFHDKMVMMIPNEFKKISKQILKYKVSILKFFNYDPFNCPKCGKTMFKVCYIDGG